ncbi:hypothetical protein FisN_23Lh179 [Fistulifera solaris]|uniref:Plastid lipid-associated protein/fibrillin conserved domain-containing protein n=1 Tax=Fistulifera solaris TaxID=1519565 RepID=A0A1Z5K551_FISSO|nr:hypothetical protein FisN_23Lh179 [Fistulifera solaris]|eukprot:GAX21231.1 hypothetical protein FisN_23Lh179 [Fistulifera solaris]
MKTRILLIVSSLLLGSDAFTPLMRSMHRPGMVVFQSSGADDKEANGDREMSAEEESEVVDAKMEQVPRNAEFDPVALPDEVAEGSTTSDELKQRQETKQEEVKGMKEEEVSAIDFESVEEPDAALEEEEQTSRNDNTKSENATKNEEWPKKNDTMHDTNKEDDKQKTADNISFLQSLGAITGRGEFATKVQKQAAAKSIRALEAVNPTERPITSDHIYGRWELLYCSTQLFRSSPFFMAGRAVCKTDIDRDRYNWFCDMHRQALAISSIQAVRQIITKSGRIVSEFEVSAGAVPFIGAKKGYSGGLPLSIEGALVSSADWVPVENSTAMELFMDTVEVKGSNLPILRLLLDQDSSKLYSRRLANKLERVIPSYKTPKPIFKTTFLDKSLRISRDQDDNVFVYIKTSEDDSVTNYSDREADLGVKKLMYGFRKVLFP